MEPAAFSPSLAKIKKGDYKSTFYLHCLAKVNPGKADEYMTSVKKELSPMAKKWGMQLAGCYRVVAGEASSDEVYTIWTAGDMIAGWHAIREASLKDPAFKRWEAKAGTWRQEVEYKFLLGLVPFSPLRMKEDFLQAVLLMKKK